MQPYQQPLGLPKSCRGLLEMGFIVGCTHKDGTIRYRAQSLIKSKGRIVH